MITRSRAKTAEPVASPKRPRAHYKRLTILSSPSFPPKLPSKSRPKSPKKPTLKPPSQPTSASASLCAPTSNSESVATTSLRALMLRHARTRLYVHPLLWTAVHLDVLDIHFVHKTSPAEYPHLRRRRLRGRKDVPYSKDLLCAAKWMGVGSADSQRNRFGKVAKHFGLSQVADGLVAIPCNTRPHFKELLITFCFNSCPSLQVLYNGREVARVRPCSIFMAHSGRYLAYINFEIIATRRDEHIWRQYTDKGPFTNAPLHTVLSIKHKRVKPAAEEEDPFIVGVLIAMAQKQRQQSDCGTSHGNGQGEMVCAVGFPVVRARVAYFYEAYIPSGFLDRFEKPSKPIKCGGFTVSYVEVKFFDPQAAIDAFRQVFTSNGLVDGDSAC